MNLVRLPSNAESEILRVAHATKHRTATIGSIPTAEFPDMSPTSVFDSIRTFWHTLTPFSLRLSRDGRIHPKTTVSIHRQMYNIAEQMSFDDLRRLFDEGHTIVYRNISDRHAAFATLSSALAMELHAWPTLNLYMSPSGGNGFAEHTDSHDVLCLQCSGTKTWTLPITVLPAQTVSLNPGDFLYLPEGIAHAARADSQPSVHLTIGFRPPTIDQFLCWLGEHLRKSQSVPSYLDFSLPSPPEDIFELYRLHWKEYISDAKLGFGRATTQKHKL